MTLSSNIINEKYELFPIRDEKTYLMSCDLIEKLDAIVLEEAEDVEEKIAYLDALAILIEAYEDKHFKFNQYKLTPIEVIEHSLEQLNINKQDLLKLMESKL